MADRPAAAADESWAFCPDTVLDFGGAGGVGTVDLRRPVSDDARAALTHLSLGQPFAIITSCDPHGRVVEASENARRTRELGGELAASGGLLAAVTGRSPDGRHAEPGFACALGRTEAVALARRWGQLGLFWFDGRVFWLLGACYEAPDTMLPRTDDRSPEHAWADTGPAPGRAIC